MFTVTAPQATPAVVPDTAGPQAQRPDVRVVEVPDLIGRTVNEARMMLASVGLPLGNGPDGNLRVRSQTPAAKTLVSRGTPVTVTVSDLPVPSSSSAPAAVGPLPPTADPSAARPTPATVQPTVPPAAQPNVSPVTTTEGFPWWALLLLAALILLGVGLARLMPKATGPTWVGSHVRVVAGLVPGLSAGAGVGAGVDVKVEEPAGRSSQTCAVRLVLNHAMDAHVLEVLDT